MFLLSSIILKLCWLLCEEVIKFIFYIDEDKPLYGFSNYYELY